MDEVAISKAQPVSQVAAKPSVQAWVVCMTAALFFFYDFIQMNLFSIINVPLMHDFHLNAAELGTLSSYFFIANALFLIPVGTILDRTSTKKTILYTLLIAIISTFAFSYVYTLAFAKLFRFTSGIASAFCFLSCVRLASRWFPTNRFALVMGFVVTMAMIGGIVAQTPAALIVGDFGWRTALRIDAVLGLFLWAFCFYMIKDYPKGMEQGMRRSQSQLLKKGYWKITFKTIFRGQVWLGAIYTCFMNFPIGLLGGIWGTLYLHYAHGQTMVSASEGISCLFLGTIVGSPLVGWISDTIGRRRLPMIIGVVLSALCFIPLLLQVDFGFTALLLMFFLVGLFTSTQILSYPYVSEISPISVTATAVSVVSFITIGSLSIFQPFFGWLLDHHAGLQSHAAGVYTAGDYFYAMWLFPACFVAALIAVLFMKESHCKRVEK